MKSCIYLIRHGITEGILNRWYYGWTDLPLVSDGFENLAELKAEGIYPELKDADVYTSGLIRTEQTLECIYGNVEHKVIPDLREMYFGAWECKSYEELQKEVGFDDWMANPDTFFFPSGGESENTFHERVQKGFKELYGFHRLKELSHRHSGKDATSILVCHGGVIAAVMETHFPNVKKNFWDWIPDCGHGAVLKYENGDLVGYEMF